MATSENYNSRHSDEAISTVAHLPKLGHIGQAVNARAYACANCRAPQTFVARRCKGRSFRKVYS
jgi:hypothetical protein